MNEVHFKSGNKEWETPDSLFKPLEKEFNIVFDVCATHSNTKSRKWFDRKTDALKYSWSVIPYVNNKKEALWMNPPYGRSIDNWVRKAYEEATKGATVIALLPARTDTSWFHNYIYNKHEVRFLKGRIKFVDAKSSAPFPSMVVVFKPKKTDKIKQIISVIKTVWKKLKSLKQYLGF